MINPESIQANKEFVSNITKDALEKDYEELKDWRKVADKYRVSYGSVLMARTRLHCFKFINAKSKQLKN